MLLLERVRLGSRTTYAAPECYVRTSFYYADTLDCLVYFYFSLPSIEACVRYDLALFPCTIRSGCVLVYNMIWLCSRVQYDLAVFSCTI